MILPSSPSGKSELEYWNDGKYWNSGIMEYWNDGLRRRRKHWGFASPHYSNIPILQEIALRDNGVLRNSGKSKKDNETEEKAHYAELAWTLSKGKSMKNERNDK